MRSSTLAQAILDAGLPGFTFFPVHGFFNVSLTSVSQSVSQPVMASS